MNNSKEFHSPDEVATLLGLHVRTIRRFIREGKLAAVRVGKQYRIADSDLEALVGSAQHTGSGQANTRRRRMTVSTTVDIDAISKDECERLVTLLVGAFHSRADEQNRKRFDSIYYEEEGRLRLLVNADLDLTNAVLGMIRGVLEDGKNN